METASEYLGQVHMSKSQKQKTEYASVTKYTHLRVVRLRLEGELVFYLLTIIFPYCLRRTAFMHIFYGIWVNEC